MSIYRLTQLSGLIGLKWIGPKATSSKDFSFVNSWARLEQLSRRHLPFPLSRISPRWSFFKLHSFGTHSCKIRTVWLVVLGSKRPSRCGRYLKMVRTNASASSTVSSKYLIFRAAKTSQNGRHCLILADFKLAVTSFHGCGERKIWRKCWFTRDRLALSLWPRKLQISKTISQGKDDRGKMFLATFHLKRAALITADKWQAPWSCCARTQLLLTSYGACSAKGSGFL